MREIIDLHSHVLPGMDDGSDSLELSLRMLRELAEQGADTVCCTSHYYAFRENIDRFRQRREKAFDRLSSGWEEGMPAIIPGAETAWFPHMSRMELEPLCLGGTHTLLVEMPFTQWSRSEVEEVVSLVLDRGYQVILVHPERFSFSKGNREFLSKLAELPIGFQVNADTFLSWKTRRQGLELLKMTQFPLLGTDCHNLTRRPPHLAKARKVIETKLGADFLEEMDENAARAIRGRDWTD